MVTIAGLGSAAPNPGFEAARAELTYQQCRLRLHRLPEQVQWMKRHRQCRLRLHRHLEQVQWMKRHSLLDGAWYERLPHGQPKTAGTAGGAGNPLAIDEQHDLWQLTSVASAVQPSVSSHYPLLMILHCNRLLEGLIAEDFWDYSRGLRRAAK